MGQATTSDPTSEIRQVGTENVCSTALQIACHSSNTASGGAINSTKPEVSPTIAPAGWTARTLQTCRCASGDMPASPARRRWRIRRRIHPTPTAGGRSARPVPPTPPPGRAPAATIMARPICGTVTRGQHAESPAEHGRRHRIEPTSRPSNSSPAAPSRRIGDAIRDGTRDDTGPPIRSSSQPATSRWVRGENRIEMCSTPGTTTTERPVPPWATDWPATVRRPGNSRPPPQQQPLQATRRQA
jgi:hypothetical protein